MIRTEVPKLTEREKTIVLLFVSGKSLKEVASDWNILYSRAKYIRDKACRKMKVSVSQLKSMSTEEVEKLTQETMFRRDFEKEVRMREEKKERQMHLWQTVVTSEQRQLMKLWYSKESVYLFKKQHSIPLKEVNKTLKELNALLEVAKAPIGYSVKDLVVFWV